MRGTYRELASLVVDADVGDMHGVGGRGDGGASRRAQYAVHEARKGALLLAAVRLSVLALGGRIALVTEPLSWALSAAIGAGRRDAFHGTAREGREACRLSELGRLELGRAFWRHGLAMLRGRRTWRVVRGLGGFDLVDALVDGLHVEGLADKLGGGPLVCER